MLGAVPEPALILSQPEPLGFLTLSPPYQQLHLQKTQQTGTYQTNTEDECGN